MSTGKLLEHFIAHDVFLNLPRHSHRILSDELNVAWNFEVGNLVAAVRFDVLIRQLEPLIELNPRANLFSHFFIGHTKYLNLGNCRMLV